MKRFASFREFYPFYLSEHNDRTSRRLHFIGSCGVLALVAKNRPATFKHPFYSFAGDWVMFKDIVSGRIPF